MELDVLEILVEVDCVVEILLEVED